MLIYFVVGEKRGVCSELCSSSGHAVVQRNAHLVAHFLNVAVPFRPDSEALNICGVLHGRCNSYSSRRCGAFPVFVPTVWLWSTVPGGNKLSGGKSSCLQAGAAKLRTDFMWKHQERRGLGTHRFQQRRHHRRL